jgi:hypothetical protein
MKFFKIYLFILQCLCSMRNYFFGTLYDNSLDTTPNTYSFETTIKFPNGRFPFVIEHAKWQKGLQWTRWITYEHMHMQNHQRTPLVLKSQMALTHKTEFVHFIQVGEMMACERKRTENIWVTMQLIVSSTTSQVSAALPRFLAGGPAPRHRDN